MTPKNTQKVRYLNPYYISFSLKKTLECQVLAQEGKDIHALPGMPEWHRVRACPC